MQIDLWASKKIPAQMGAKISYLNSIYRMKIDTTLPPIRYEEVPSAMKEDELPKLDNKPVPDKTGDKPSPAKPKLDAAATAPKPTNVPKSTTTPKPTTAEKPAKGKTVVEQFLNKC